ncbi:MULTISPECIES: restriction endonuclease subunit S [Staphylococcus]|uniref:Restriction endonuclease subunit S n=1 Tax=Staphylococcus croceilyticus TaxID=319942 RepID=A0ABY2KJK3_9STAP|nr:MULTISPECIES: restriction endonuclease subunit S [Staphylococcus]ORE71945.1 type I restriction endonuclease subunit S [Staphylococcus epidermidis]PNZ01828.1 restriction endonuclease subunit S [Staphylococcus epidermidis]PNZ66913.1 restriction endonuclease subunit S [Staphylococcus croceilyticus]QCY34947.1 restriction endonuclease subunit S [Staphylococcus epidermidis]TGA80887.1 restriction endonuclease subunit S [Staphylococcus croceilyticus]
MEFKLKDLVNIKYGKNQKNVKNPRGKYPILGTGGIMDYADDFLYDKPSVLIGRKGSIGKVKYIEEPFWTIDTLFYTIVNENLVIPKYLYYKLSQIDFNYYNEGTTIPSLRTETLYKIDIDLPKKNIQKKVVNLLNTIDEKIENNQKIIANLEKLSQTLFKHWFVDFEFPDKNGNPYKSSGGEMVDSELGEIPKGWRVETLEKLGSIVGGGTPSKKNKEYYTNNGIPWITPKDLSKNRNIYISHGENDISELGLNKSSAKLLEKNSVLFSSRAPIGYIAINNIPVTTNQGFKSIVPNEEMNPYFIYFILKNITPLIEQTASGSTFKEISAKGLKSIKIVFPSIELIEHYGNIVKKYFEEINFLENQNIKLIELRDTLLPKLMSGEIEIPDDIEVNNDELSI